jgi:hypothetical protein
LLNWCWLSCRLSWWIWSLEEVAGQFCGSWQW